MTGRNSAKATKRKATRPQQASQPPQSQAPTDDSNQTSSPPPNIRKEQPPPPQIVKKIIKTEYDEARTLKTVFKSNPDSQMKDFIKKASKPAQQANKLAAMKTPAENHPPAVAQELLDTDDDVADNLARLFKASKSYKNL